MTAGDLRDAHVSVAAGGLLARFNQAGIVSASDVQVARTLIRLAGDQDDWVALAAALTVRALTNGSVCLNLASLNDPAALSPVFDADERDAPVELPEIPPIDAWLDRLANSPAVGDQQTASNQRPLRLIDSNLYLERYWLEEETVRIRLERRSQTPPPPIDESALEAALDRWAASPDDGPHLQRLALESAARGWTSVIAGGPGTGKTTTVARLLAVIGAQHEGPLRCALAAPTGKAAARLQDAFAAQAKEIGLPSQVRIDPAVTTHRLLGFHGSTQSFTYGTDRPLPFDVVVIDEMSMVALPMMSQLLAALPDSTRLILVGDPHQLSSVEAGAVLADIVAADPPLIDTASASSPLANTGPASRLRMVTQLRHTWRFGGDIAKLANAIREGDVDAALSVVDRSNEVSLIDVDPRATSIEELDDLMSMVVAAGTRMIDAARHGDAKTALLALNSHRLLCAHRVGGYGSARWGAQVEQVLRRRGLIAPGDWYLGRPILVTANNRTIGINNGDSGVVVTTPEGPQVALDSGDAQATTIQPFLLDQVETLYAMTVHKSQGSQYQAVTVLLPPPDSPLGTRDMIYTAITRAVTGVSLIGTREALIAAISRPSQRASGLASRLGRSSPASGNV